MSFLTARNGIPVGVSPHVTIVGAIAAIFSPLSLFSTGAQGAWYDPSDLTTLFQDSAGTTPVTAVGQPVGLVLDKSGRGNNAFQVTAASRPLLQQDSNGYYHLLFDGVDDWLQTNSVNFTTTDKMTVFAGVRKLSNAAIGMIVELSPVTTTNNGTFFMRAPGVALTDYSFSSKGTIVSSAASANTYSAPITNVLTGTGDISGDQVVLRIDGAQVAISTTDQGTGNYGNHALYVGRRGGTALTFSGNMYQLIVCGAQTSLFDIQACETYVNSKTGAYA